MLVSRSAAITYSNVQITILAKLETAAVMVRFRFRYFEDHCFPQVCHIRVRCRNAVLGKNALVVKAALFKRSAVINKEAAILFVMRMKDKAEQTLFAVSDV